MLDAGGASIATPRPSRQVYRTLVFSAADKFGVAFQAGAFLALLDMKRIATVDLISGVGMGNIVVGQILSALSKWKCKEKRGDRLHVDDIVADWMDFVADRENAIAQVVDPLLAFCEANQEVLVLGWRQFLGFKLLDYLPVFEKQYEGLRCRDAPRWPVVRLNGSTDEFMGKTQWSNANGGDLVANDKTVAEIVTGFSVGGATTRCTLLATNREHALSSCVYHDPLALSALEACTDAVLFDCVSDNKGQRDDFDYYDAAREELLRTSTQLFSKMGGTVVKMCSSLENFDGPEELVQHIRETNAGMTSLKDAARLTANLGYALTFSVLSPGTLLPPEADLPYKTAAFPYNIREILRDGRSML